MTDPTARPPWDFDYAPIAMGGGDTGQPARDLIVATTEDLDPVEITRALADAATDVSITPLFNSHPIFWTRIEASSELDQGDVLRRLGSSRVRYVASAERGSQRLPPPLDLGDGRPRYARQWAIRPPSTEPDEDTPWRWFLRARGVEVDRAYCGTGAGTRLAVIDNDGLDLEHIALDAEIPVGVESIPRSHSHAALMLGWAIGARRPDGRWFRGVAPDASPRLYCIPKPEANVWTLPLAIARAVEDGADVILCATYVEGQTSPMLDDALEFAVRLGRAGRGALVVMPTGREMASPRDSIHSSLSLGLAEPAGDPRVFCIGPSARDGGWFLWRDRRGRLRPFANRGPSLRWLAPGDDLAHPFSSEDRAWHAESSGASGVASGVMLLALAQNPSLTTTELESLLYETALVTDPGNRHDEGELADASDLHPSAVDADGHNAKHGYGRLNALAACMGASDPIALTLCRMGEHDAARAFLDARWSGSGRDSYSTLLAHFCVRHLLVDVRTSHAAASILRALRLWSRHPERLAQQPPGHLLRQLGIVARLFAAGACPEPCRDELLGLELSLRAVHAGGQAAGVEQSLLGVFDAAAWSATTGPTARRTSEASSRKPAEEPPQIGRFRLGSV